MVKAVLFDFWGTLVENGTYSPLKQSYRILRVRVPFSQFVEQFERVVMTSQFEDQAQAFEEACKSFNVNPLPIIIDRLIGVWNKNRLLAKVYPDTVDTLKALKEKGVKIAIVSNAPQHSVEQVLERFQLTELFDGIFVSHAEGKLKTDGLFDVALEKLGLSAGEVISVGDSIETDIRGAEMAGIAGYLIDRRNSREFERKIVSLKEILDLVEG
ncbi:HAD family hydrolase [Candidatus Woesearchaeota archaeon]|nr:MAG: HAD family hydrolase [Candidatus Woesearchaeota archaeon]